MYFSVIYFSIRYPWYEETNIYFSISQHILLLNIICKSGDVVRNYLKNRRSEQICKIYEKPSFLFLLNLFFTKPYCWQCPALSKQNSFEFSCLLKILSNVFETKFDNSYLITLLDGYFCNSSIFCFIIASMVKVACVVNTKLLFYGLILL